jgi:hypothetical protein
MDAYWIHGKIEMAIWRCRAGGSDQIMGNGAKDRLEKK